MENADSIVNSGSIINSELFKNTSIEVNFQDYIFYILVLLIFSIIGFIYYRNPDFLAGAERNMNILSENMDFYKNKILLSINMDNGAVKSYSSL
jgi:hypothetical protein